MAVVIETPSRAGAVIISSDTRTDGQTAINALKGEKGDQGVQGIQGIQGLKGDKGDKGETGDTGPAGSDATVTPTAVTAAVLASGAYPVRNDVTQPEIDCLWVAPSGQVVMITGS
jgi:hypothetical protein